MQGAFAINVGAGNAGVTETGAGRPTDEPLIETGTEGKETAGSAAAEADSSLFILSMRGWRAADMAWTMSVWEA